MDEYQEYADEGDEFAPTASGEEVEAAAETDTLQADSAEETKTEKPSETIAELTEEGKEVSETEAKEKDDSSEQSLEDVLADVDKEIADPKHPKWFKAKLEGVKKAFLRETDSVKSTYEPLKDFGEVEQIKENLEILAGLDAIETDPQTNLPKQTVKPFVDKLVEKRGAESAVAIMQELGNVQSPNGNGFTLAHELIAAQGLDPRRIEDFKRFAENGYRLGEVEIDPEVLESIPEHLREAFISLNEEEREDILLLNESLRDKSLKGIQNELDKERTEAENEKKNEAEKVQKEFEEKQQFYQAVNVRHGEIVDQSGEQLFNTFTESLVNAGVDELESVAYGAMMSFVLSSTGAEARAAIAVLEKMGVKLDESLQGSFVEWNEVARNTATFETQGNEASKKTEQGKFDTLQTKLIRKSNPIVMAIAQYKANQKADKIQARNSTIDKTLKHNGINANEGKPSAINMNREVNTDFSDRAYLADEYA